MDLASSVSLLWQALVCRGALSELWGDTRSGNREFLVMQSRSHTEPTWNENRKDLVRGRCSCSTWGKK